MSIESFASRDGTRIACFKSGAGSPLVLAHGTTADHARWAPVLPALEQRFTVYACDGRGRGASGDAAAYAVEREFEDLAAVVDGIGGLVDVIGHSHGAICALEASTRARHLRRLVLYEPPIPVASPTYPPGIVETLQARLDAGDRDGVVEAFLRDVARVPPGALALMRTSPAWQRRVAAAHTIVREMRADNDYAFEPERFAWIETPTLLLLGGSSPPFFQAAIERLHAALPKSRVVVLPDQTHVAMDTAPELFVQQVLAFLE